MNMPLTEYPNMPNVSWGNSGIPNSYPIALGAWKDWTPGGFSGKPATIYHAAAIGALIYVGYRLFKGAKATHGKIKRSYKRKSYVRSATSAAARAAAESAAREFDDKFN